jgi:hypothetical protein
MDSNAIKPSHSCLLPCRQDMIWVPFHVPNG